MSVEGVAYGTKSVGTYFTMPFTGCDLNLNANEGSSNNIDTNPAIGRVWRQGTWIAGTISGIPTYENLELLWWGLTGAQGVSAGTDPYTNTYDLAIALPSFTIAVDADDRSGSCYYYTGCKVSSLSLNWSSGGEPSFSASFVGQDEDGIAAAPGGPTAMSEVVIAPTDNTVKLTGDAGTPCVSSASFNFDWGIQPGPYCLGSTAATLEPKVTNKLALTGSFTVVNDDGSAWDLFKAGTPITAMNFAFEGPAGGANEKLTIDVNRAIYTNGTGYNISGPGDIPYSMNFSAYGNAANEPFSIITINSIEADIDIV